MKQMMESIHEDILELSNMNIIHENSPPPTTYINKNKKLPHFR